MGANGRMMAIDDVAAKNKISVQFPYSDREEEKLLSSIFWSSAY